MPMKNLKVNGLALDESRWEPEDDFTTQESIAQGRTMGCFYIESPGHAAAAEKGPGGRF